LQQRFIDRGTSLAMAAGASGAFANARQLDLFRKPPPCD